MFSLLYSKLLYELYKSIKGRQNDDENDSGETLANNISVMTKLVEQALQMSNVQGVQVSSRLIQQFKTKIWRLNETMVKAKRSGGKGFKSLMSKWTSGRYSTWKFKIYYSELELDKVKQLNGTLVEQNRQLAGDLGEERLKNATIENKLKQAIATNQATTGDLKKKFKRLALKFLKQQRGQTSRGPSKKKKYSEYSRRHQSRVKKQMVTDCETSLSFLGLNNFIATKVEVFNEITHEYEMITLLDEEEVDTSCHTETLTDEEIDKINLLLYTKDRFNISNEAYHELSMTCNGLPKSWRVQEKINYLNAKWSLSETPGDTFGIQQDVKERVKIRLEALLKNSSPNDPFRQNSKICVKLSGDGTNIGKRLHVINVTFTILDEGNKSMSADGNHLIAIIKETEDYDSLAQSMADIRKDVESFKYVSVGTECFYVEWFLGGDWKFLACVCGLGAATSNHPCIWCRCELYHKYDGRKEWSLLDTTKGARSIQELQQTSSIRSRGVERYNVKHSPLFPSIALDHVVIDALHLFLRISDNLINLLILEFRRQDSIEKKIIFTDGFLRSKYQYMARWESYLNDTLKISFHWYVCKDSKKLKWRDLTGPEKLKLFRNINIDELLPGHPQSGKISELWKQFLSITDILSSNAPQVSKEQIQGKSKLFLEQFLKLYHTKHVTPYMHALVWHVPEFIEMYGEISPFTQQGLEKLNDKTTKDYFRSTNQRGLDCLKQIMLKRNRVEHLEDIGCKRVKRSFKCSNCSLPGHNIKTCLHKCSSCLFTPCCSPLHIYKSSGKWLKKCEYDDTFN